VRFTAVTALIVALAPLPAADAARPAVHAASPHAATHHRRVQRPKDSVAPTVPSSVAVAASTPTSITIAWSSSTDNVGVAGYSVYLDGARVSTTSSLGYTAAGLSCGTTHVLGVEAFDAAKNVSARSSVTGATGPCASTGLAPLSAAGNHIWRNGRVFTFHGVNRDSLEWGRYNWGGCGGDGHFTNTDFDRIASWKVTSVRIPLSEAAWLGRRCDPAAYASLVDAAVAKANARGMYAILDLHWSDVGGLAPCDSGCRTGQQPMPDAGSLTFWRQVAERYGGNPGVVFDLYNEPHGVSWGCWRNGGCTVTSSTTNPATGQKVAYTAVGMQQLYNAVRASAPSTLVLVAGLDWAYDLSGVTNGFALAGTNVAYDTHVYVRWHYTTTDWDAHFGGVTKAFPVTATEFGSTDCSTTVTSPLLGYLDAPMGVSANAISWAIWSWNSPGSCGQPSVVADWSGTPLAGQGQLVHDALQAHWP
jgi:endoglucanase